MQSWCRPFSGLGISRAPRKSVFESTFWGGTYPFYFQNRSYWAIYSEKRWNRPTTGIFGPWAPETPIFGRPTERPIWYMISWVDCWCFRECNHTFQKSAIFSCSGAIFVVAKIEVFQGFQSSSSISTLIPKPKMVAPSMKALSKALISELSIEPSTKGLAILLSKLC